MVAALEEERMTSKLLCIEIREGKSAIPPRPYAAAFLAPVRTIIYWPCLVCSWKPRDMNASCKREQAPASWLRTMRERFRRRLTFHGVGVGPEDFQLLEELCSVAQVTRRHLIDRGWGKLRRKSI